MGFYSEAMKFQAQDLFVRTKKFALRIATVYSSLEPGSPLAQVIGKQMLRSGTSVGAHVREARHSRSNAEMFSKVSVALQELEETRYWLELLEESRTVQAERLTDLCREADELKAILFASARSIRRLGTRGSSLSIVH
jgi:four helix bundle protein